ncbi:hypothetical protein [Lysobacter gummosus]|uniref:hypothetical protein n=1 Tax=Lysobacter gummosus TaxID=262324 RepID=UPI00363550C0
MPRRGGLRARAASSHRAIAPLSSAAQQALAQTFPRSACPASANPVAYAFCRESHCKTFTSRKKLSRIKAFQRGYYQRTKSGPCAADSA